MRGLQCSENSASFSLSETFARGSGTSYSCCLSFPVQRRTAADLGQPPFASPSKDRRCRIVSSERELSPRVRGRALYVQQPPSPGSHGGGVHDPRLSPWIRCPTVAASPTLRSEPLWHTVTLPGDAPISTTARKSGATT